MNKTSKTGQITLFFLLVVAIFSTTFSTFGQENAEVKYQVGDRVECYLSWGGYYKGTVVNIEREGWMYRVKFDFTKDTINMELPCLVKQMRPLKAGDETAKKETPDAEPKNNNKNQKPADRNDFNYLADREIMECPIEQKPAKNGAKPNAELLKKVIRCLYERPAPDGLDGAKTADITAFQIGVARKWKPLEDIGNGSLGTIVYPIKATWIQRTFYQSYTQQIDSISIFNCYVSAVGDWECGLAQRVKEGEIKRLPPK